MKIGKPVFDGNRCVHDHSPVARCASCIERCPVGAITLGEEALLLDAGLCDGCGLCVASCPEVAISSDAIEPQLRETDDMIAVFVACEVSSAAANMPCVHAIGVGALLRWHGNDIEAVISTTGDCGTCPRGRGGPSLEAVLEEVNEIAATRGQRTLRHWKLGARAWEMRFKRSREFDPRAQNRRAFLRMLKAAVAPVEAGHSGDPAVLPYPDTRAGRDPARAVYAAAPRIEVGRCSGCDACVRLCPHGALSYERDAQTGASQYSIDAGCCTGCGLCTDVCPTDAVTVVVQSEAGPTAVVLRDETCAACGVSFHVPAAAENSGLCPICQSTQHHQKLFQIHAE